MYARTGTTWAVVPEVNGIVQGNKPALANGPFYGWALDVTKVGPVVYLAVGAPQQNGGYAPGGGLPPLANVALSGAVWLSKYQPGALPAFSLYGYVQGTEATTDAPGAVGKGFGRAFSLSKDANILAVGIPLAEVTLAATACGGIVRAFLGSPALCHRQGSPPLPLPPVRKTPCFPLNL